MVRADWRTFGFVVSKLGLQVALLVALARSSDAYKNVSIEILCELLLLNQRVVMENGGVPVVVAAVLECESRLQVEAVSSPSSFFMFPPHFCPRLSASSVRRRWGAQFAVRLLRSTGTLRWC